MPRWEIGKTSRRRQRWPGEIDRGVGKRRQGTWINKPRCAPGSLGYWALAGDGGEDYETWQVITRRSRHSENHSLAGGCTGWLGLPLGRALPSAHRAKARAE